MENISEILEEISSPGMMQHDCYKTYLSCFVRLLSDADAHALCANPDYEEWPLKRFVRARNDMPKRHVGYPANIPVKQLIEAFTTKRSGKKVSSRSEMQRRFAYLDFDQQMAIANAMIDSYTKTDTLWLCRVLDLGFYDTVVENLGVKSRDFAAFENRMMALCTNYLDELFVVKFAVERLPFDYVDRHKSKIIEAVGYRPYCLRMAQQPSFTIEKGQLEFWEYLQVLAHSHRQAAPGDEDRAIKYCNDLITTYSASTPVKVDGFMDTDALDESSWRRLPAGHQTLNGIDADISLTDLWVLRRMAYSCARLGFRRFLINLYVIDKQLIDMLRIWELSPNVHLKDGPLIDAYREKFMEHAAALLPDASPEEWYEHLTEAHPALRDFAETFSLRIKEQPFSNQQ